MDDFAAQQELKTYTDAELALEVQAGNQTAFEEMTKRYRGLISYIAGGYSAAGFEHADFIQEGLLALLSACKTYDGNKKASFRNYAGVCISNRFMSVIRRAGAKGAIPQDSIVPFEGIELSDHNLGNPETLILQQESSKDLKKLIRDKLSPLETDVLKAYLSGLSYAQIAEDLSVSPKSVDNALQRIRRKIAQGV